MSEFTAPAFHTPVLPTRRVRSPLITRGILTCALRGTHRPTRRRFLRESLALSGAVAGALPLQLRPSGAAEKLNGLERAVVPVVMCRTIMVPVRRYISEGAWDKGRTNVNYCTRVLAVRSRMRDAAELLEGDAFYDAMYIMGEMSNTMAQLDASLYTPLFIPADEGISLEQRKYQTQAFGFYEDALQYLDTFLSKVPETALEKAKSAAASAKYEIRLETE